MKRFSSAVIVLALLLSCSAQAFEKGWVIYPDDNELQLDHMCRTVNILIEDYGLDADSAEQVYTLCTQAEMHTVEDNATFVYGYVWDVKAKFSYETSDGVYVTGE